MASKSCKALCGSIVTGTDQSAVGGHVWRKALMQRRFEDLQGSCPRIRRTPDAPHRPSRKHVSEHCHEPCWATGHTRHNCADVAGLTRLIALLASTDQRVVDDHA